MISSRTLNSVIGCALFGMACGAENPSDRVGSVEEALSSPIADLDCQAVNNFGYVGALKGGLKLDGSRLSDGSLPVKGTLDVKVWQYGQQPKEYHHVDVKGFVDKTGQYSLDDVVGGASELESLTLYFRPGVISSSINSKKHIRYQTECSKSHLNAPHGSDLQLTGAMRFYPSGTGNIGVQIDVFNVGDRPATGPSGQASVAGHTVSAALYQYFGGTATTPNTVNPSEKGYLKIDIPSFLNECSSYPVHIDLTHSMQSGAPDPFGNDNGFVSTQCMISWTSGIDAKRLGSTPDSHVLGKTLQDIVSSRTVARADGNVCSACHYQGSPRVYSPPVAQYATTLISPFDMIGGRMWVGDDGWGQHFINQGPGTAGSKPAYLRDVFQKWRQDGQQ